MTEPDIILCRHILSVSALTRFIRQSLESRFSDVWIDGEVSNLRVPNSGHMYFTLKDDQAQIRSVLFRSGAARLRFALREGLSVIVRGRVTVYEPRGEYQLVVDYAEPKGIGALQLAFEQLKERLAAEGLFDPARKRPLPLFPGTIGVVTSPTGAAIRDILAVLGRRYPVANVLIAPVPVQGEGAAEQIAAAIHSLGGQRDVDVMIVGRGGGTWEDLWAFNEEPVVRAIAGARVPVVSAVGHEVDVTLSDFAADYRAPTPSAAAEAVTPVLEEIVAQLAQMHARLRRCMQMNLLQPRHQVERCLGLLADTRYLLHRHVQQLDEAENALVRWVTALVTGWHRHALELDHLIRASGPHRAIRTSMILVPQLFQRLAHAARRGMLHRRELLHTRMASLDALSPLAILERGYSLVQTIPEGRILKRASDVRCGDRVQARLAEGRLVCSVEEVLPPGST
jgi:exodeoxyribonuclease VII large subunit